MHEFTKIDAAKFLYRLIASEMEKVRASAISAAASLCAAYESNTQFQKERDKEDFGGWGAAKPPYNEYQIKQLSADAAKQQEAFELWKKTKEWYFEDIAEKYIKN